jgi:hypothetical protein
MDWPETLSLALWRLWRSVTLASLGAPFPRRHLFRRGPQTGARLPGLEFGFGICTSVCLSLLAFIAFEVPCHSRTYLFQANVHAAHHHAADLAPVTVDLVTLRDRRLPVCEVGQALLRNAAEGLTPFWGVDAIQANDVLALVGIQHRQRVAISHTHDVTGDGGCARGAGECCKAHQDEEKSSSHSLTIVQPDAWPTPSEGGMSF